MIFDLILSVLMGVVTGVLGLLPAYSPSFGGVGGSLGSALAGANSVFPVTTLGACLAFIVGFRLFLLAATFVTWLWAKIPFTFK